jgi:hypothetical protein
MYNVASAVCETSKNNSTEYLLLPCTVASSVSLYQNFEIYISTMYSNSTHLALR